MEEGYYPKKEPKGSDEASNPNNDFIEEHEKTLDKHVQGQLMI